jgi:hypothetical protein
LFARQSLYNHNPQASASFLLFFSRFFCATAGITMYITVDDLRHLEPVLILLSESEVENISKVQFSLKDDATYKKKARQLAVQNAKEKAEEIAKKLTISVDTAVVVQEIPQEKIQPDDPFQRYYQCSRHEYVALATHAGGPVGASVSDSGLGYFSDTIHVYSSIKVVFNVEE